MKKIFALFMAALIINISIMAHAVLPVSAMPISPIADGLYETFSRIFGNALGTYKSTNEMGYNYTLSCMQDFFDHQILGEPYYWEEDTAIEGISDRLTLRGYLETALDNVNSYNNGLETMQGINALNNLSYSASGSMASVTLEDKITDTILLLDNMSDADYSIAFEELCDALFSENGAGSITNMKTGYKLFEGIMSMLITNTSYDSTNEWYTPVTDSSYNYSALNNSSFMYNNVPIYYTYTSNIVTNLGNGNFCATSPIYYFILKYSDSSKGGVILMISDNYFQYNYVGYNACYTITLNGKTFYYSSPLSNGFTSCSIPMNSIPKASATSYQNYILDYYSLNMCGNNFEAEKIASVGGMAPAFNLALDAFFSKGITAEDVADLADDLAAVDEAVGTDLAIQALTDAVAGITVTLPDAIVDGKNDVVEAVDGLGDIILTLPKAIWNEFADTMEGIQTKVNAKPWEGENTKDSNDILIILDALLLLILIIVALLKIFIHCLAFIINIFAIPASTAFLPDDMILGLNYIKTLEIPGLGMSVYDFMMGLVYILIVFFAIRVLRSSVDRIRVPKQRSGGLNG